MITIKRCQNFTKLASVPWSDPGEMGAKVTQRGQNSSKIQQSLWIQTGNEMKNRENRKIVARARKNARRACNNFDRNSAPLQKIWTQVALSWKIVLLYKKILGYNNSYCETLTKYSSESWWIVLLRTVPQTVIIQTERGKCIKSCKKPAMLWYANEGE